MELYKSFQHQKYLQIAQLQYTEENQQKIVA